MNIAHVTGALFIGAERLAALVAHIRVLARVYRHVHLEMRPVLEPDNIISIGINR